MVGRRLGLFHLLLFSHRHGDELIVPPLKPALQMGKESHEREREREREREKERKGE
jgi:hypothetical protein